MQVTMKEKKIMHAQTLKTHVKKCLIKSHNLCEKKVINFFYYLNSMVNHSWFVFKTHKFHWIIKPNS
jgi:hypothetical protein